MQLAFCPVKTQEDQKQLARLADEIWHEYWPAIIGQAQTDYMVNRFQSLEAIKRDMECARYEYWLIRLRDSGELVGYTGGHEEPETNRYFISKIYLRKEHRGKGFARETIIHYEALAAKRGLFALYLTVNKHNVQGIRAYRGLGFLTIDAVETDIGDGFVMDDYIMEKEVLKTQSPQADLASTQRKPKTV